MLRVVSYALCVERRVLCALSYVLHVTCCVLPVVILLWRGHLSPHLSFDLSGWGGITHVNTNIASSNIHE